MSEEPSNPPPASLDLPELLPVLPLKDSVLFPFVIVPLSISRPLSIEAVDHAIGVDRLILAVSQRSSRVETPKLEDLHEIGTVATILRMLRLPDGRTRILVQGLARARLEALSRTEPYLHGRLRALEPDELAEPSLGSEALVRSTRENLERIVQLGHEISPEVMVIAANLDDPGRLADLAASNLDLRAADAQEILAQSDPEKRLGRVNLELMKEIQVLRMQRDLSSQARDDIDQTQREYFLRQQLKTIRSELGESSDLAEEIREYRVQAESKGLPEEAQKELERQLERLERTHPESSEGSLLRGHLDWLTGLPWARCSQDRIDLERAERVLDADHYGLEKIKERILEFLAVRKLRADARGPILCFVGPPGVGKTSLGRSIARALGREFARLSLGGVRDEAEIRGHRRTYVGALPGRILQGLRQAERSNPVFMLDEVDKIGQDFRGDPSAALLEVLDAEQNHTFRDHYLGVPYDLSRILFIATANVLDPIHPAFLDRMEVIRLAGYTAEEKIEIARRHLLPKLLAEHGLSGRVLRFTRTALDQIIRGYTREAGLRNLERKLARICRQTAMRVARGESGALVVTPAKLDRLLGARPHHSEEMLEDHRVGVATGLAWTAAGGDLLFVEVALLAGKGRLTLTGQLGEVMKESGRAAMTFAHSWLERGPASLAERLSSTDIHVHAPAGAIPKDGPSAGITIATAIISAFERRPVVRGTAMTGEITLRGDVLPVGGLKEKLLAARAAGISKVILPELNRRDLREIPPEVRRDLELHFVRRMEEVLEHGLLGDSNRPRATGS